MKAVRTILLISTLAVAGPGLAATVRELDVAELREAARSGDLISLKRVIESVSQSTGGDAIEARAFEIEDVYYRIVLKKANGSVISIIINARTGEQVSKNSIIGRELAAAAGGGKGNKGKSATAGSNGKSGGNSGGSASGGGNGGGGGGGGGNGGGGKD